MQFDQILTTETDALIQHDAAGDAIQTHELSTGELLLTFSDEWCAEQGYQIGDTIRFVIDEVSGALQLINVTKGEREAS
jgi:hypothetical protein